MEHPTIIQVNLCALQGHLNLVRDPAIQGQVIGKVMNAITVWATRVPQTPGLALLFFLQLALEIPTDCHPKPQDLAQHHANLKMT